MVQLPPLWFCGTARYLKEQNPNIKVIGVDAYGSVLKKYHETGKFDEKEIYPYKLEAVGCLLYTSPSPRD